MSAKPDIRDLLDMDPEDAFERFEAEYEELIEDLRNRGKDDVADVIESTVKPVQEGLV